MSETYTPTETSPENEQQKHDTLENNDLYKEINDMQSDEKFNAAAALAAQNMIEQAPAAAAQTKSEFSTSDKVAATFGVALIGVAGGLGVNENLKSNEPTFEVSPQTIVVDVHEGDSIYDLVEQVKGHESVDKSELGNTIAHLTPHNEDVFKIGLQPGMTVDIPVEVTP